MYEIKTEQFQGPLDLLLSLIESQKLDISQIALAQVTDQYLTYLDQSQDIGATELADFLVVATKLLIIKSRILLPQTADEDAIKAMDDFAAMNEVYAAQFGTHRPARSTVAVKTLPKNALVEIDCVALV